MKKSKKIYVDDKLIRNDISFDKKTSIKSLFDFDDLENNSIGNVGSKDVIRDNDLFFGSEVKNYEPINYVYENDNHKIEESKNINLNINLNQDINLNKKINNSIESSESDFSSKTETINQKYEYIIENNYVEGENEFIDHDSNIICDDEVLESNTLSNNKTEKNKKRKILPWMLATTSLLLAGTSTATIVLSVLPSDGLSQSQSNTVDRNVNFELKHDRSKIVNDTNIKLQNEFKNSNIDMDKYFFGMNLINKENFKFDSQEKLLLLSNMKKEFIANKINFIYNIVDTIVLNNKNSIAWNYYGINAIKNNFNLKQNVDISSYKASDVFLIDGFYQMEFSFNINGFQQTNSLKNSNGDKIFSIKFKDSNDIDQKSYIEITDKTNKEKPIIEIKEIVDIYSKFLLLNEYSNRNDEKSYLSINPFKENTKNIFDKNNDELFAILKKYNSYVNSNYFYQFIQNKSLSLEKTSIKNIFDSNKSLMDNNIINGVNNLSSFIFNDSNEIKNIFTFLGIEDLLKNNKNISSLKINDIKLSNFVSISNGNSNKISGSLFSNITYINNQNIETNYYSYIFIESQNVKEDLQVKYHVATSNDGKSFTKFVEKDWNIQWTPIEILVQKENIKNKEVINFVDIKNDINKIAITANDTSFDTIKSWLKSNNFNQYVIQNSSNKDMLEFIESGIQYNVSIKSWLFDVPCQEFPNDTQENKNNSFEKRIRTYWMYYFLDEINTIDEKLGQSKTFDSKNPFIEKVTIDLVEWSGLLINKSNKESLNYQFKIRYSYTDLNNKKIIVDKVVSASNDNFYNFNKINHYLPTVTIKESINIDSNVSDKISFYEKMDISKNIESFIIKSTRRL